MKFVLSAFSDEASPDFVKQLEALKRNQISNLEIRGVNGKSIHQQTNEELAVVKKQMEEYGVGLSAIGSAIGKISIEDDFAPHVEDFKRVMEIAHILGTDNIRMFSFFLPKGKDPKNYRNEVLERLNTLLELSEKEGLYCCHENEKEIYGDTKERCLDLFSVFGGRLHGIFDPANFIQCGEDPASIIDELLPHMHYMHIKDAKKASGAVVPCGYGDGSIPLLLQKFNQDEGECFLTVEPHLTVFDGLSGLQDEELKHEFTYPSGDAAFDAACQAVRDILKNGNFNFR